METLARAANRGSIPTGYEIDNSLKFEPDNAETIATTNQAAGNQKTWTWSCWLKRTELGSLQTIFGAGETFIRFDTPDIIQTFFSSGSSVSTNQVFRDTSAWYHLVWILDTTQATAADRSRIYINGSQITSFSAASYPAQNADLTVGGTGSSTNFLRLAQYWAGGRNYAGYMAEIHYLNGTVAEPTEFGEYDSDSGIWIPKQYTGGGYGTQGFYYKFDNASNLGEDSSDEGHDANSLGNITSADQATDTPTNNFCTMNPLLQNPAAITPMTEGATFITGASSSTNWESRFGTFAVTNGKWYTELKADGAKYTNNIFVGFCGTEYTLAQSDNHLVYGGEASNPGAVALYSFNGDLSYGGTGVHGFRIYDGDIVALMLDADNGAMYFKRLAGPNSNSSEGTISWSQDGTNTADPTSGASKTGAQLVDWDGATVVAVSVAKNVGGIEMNFGGYNIISNTQSYTDANGYGSFVMQPPSGYYALCTKNLAEFG